MSRLIIGLFICFLFNSLEAQYNREDIFVDLDGEALRQALIENYNATGLLSYGDARDILFGEIDIKNDTLKCVYTGYAIYLDPALDPTEAAFSQNINTEHTFPRSKGADDFTPGYRDMHHLFPTRVNVNATRGSLPFSEIEDNLTDEWFTDNLVTTSIPFDLCIVASSSR